jgi:hypothetical protein
MGRAVGDTSAGMVVEAETDSLAVKTVVAVERTAEEPLETWKKDHGRTAAVLGVLVVGLRSGIGNHCLVAALIPTSIPSITSFSTSTSGASSAVSSPPTPITSTSAAAPTSVCTTAEITTFYWMFSATHHFVKIRRSRQGSIKLVSIVVIIFDSTAIVIAH